MCRFATCVDQPDLTTRATCLGAGGSWKNPRMGHFDDFASAMLMLFECATFEGWPDVMFAAIDARAIGMQPVEGHNSAWALFFLLVIVFGAFS